MLDPWLINNSHPFHTTETVFERSFVGELNQALFAFISSIKSAKQTVVGSIMHTTNIYKCTVNSLKVWFGLDANNKMLIY